MTPNEFMPQLKSYLLKNGVVILENQPIEELVISGEKIATVKTKNQEFKADEFVIAAGSWIQELVKKLGISIPIQAGKGYRINVERLTDISIPAILTEVKVAVTPMNGLHVLQELWKLVASIIPSLQFV